jgi:hypothetical protein
MLSYQGNYVEWINANTKRVFQTSSVTPDYIQNESCPEKKDMAPGSITPQVKSIKPHSLCGYPSVIFSTIWLSIVVRLNHYLSVNQWLVRFYLLLRVTK